MPLRLVTHSDAARLPHKHSVEGMSSSSKDLVPAGAGGHPQTIPDSAPQMVQLFGKAMELMNCHSTQRNMVLTQMKNAQDTLSRLLSSGFGF